MVWTATAARTRCSAGAHLADDPGPPRADPWLDDLQRVATSPPIATHLGSARRTPVTCGRPRLPTLVLPAGATRSSTSRRADTSRRTSPRAFVTLESNNHIVLGDEPAWPAFVPELEVVLAPAEAVATGGVGDVLSPREREVLSLAVDGLVNDEIAAAVQDSVGTVERPSTTSTPSSASARAPRAAESARCSPLADRGRPYVGRDVLSALRGSTRCASAPCGAASLASGQSLHPRRTSDVAHGRRSDRCRERPRRHRRRARAAGAATAMLLARAGHDVLLLDRPSRPAPSALAGPRRCRPAVAVGPAGRSARQRRAPGALGPVPAARRGG